jgi:predicted ATPase
VRLKKITVHNYKSLRYVTFCPTPLTAIVGPNGSGKTNFSDAVDFLSDVYTHGLELAVVRKGGFENIAFRKMRRTKSAIEFEVTLELLGSELRRTTLTRRHAPFLSSTFRLVHRFAIRTSGAAIRADFKVLDEEFLVSMRTDQQSADEEFKDIVRVSVGSDRKLVIEAFEKSPVADEVLRYARTYSDIFEDRGLTTAQELFVIALPLRNAFFSAFVSAIGRFEVYQISPRLSRTSGVPTPNPKLSRAGENLPALVDWIQRKHPAEWEVVMNGMRDVLPGLVDISVDYLHNKTLGLFFHEEGMGRPWAIEDVSDGTVQTLALLVATADPRTTLLLIEEPENSVHPWIIRVIVERLQQMSGKKDVIVTSHSPVLVNLIQPNELWVTSRSHGETHMQRLVDLEPDIVGSWENGKIRLSEFLDAGFVPQAVPGGA